MSGLSGLSILKRYEIAVERVVADRASEERARVRTERNHDGVVEMNALLFYMSSSVKN